MKLALHALRFGLELCMLAAVSYWAVELDASTIVRLALAVIVPVAVCVVWGLFVAPKAARPLPRWAWVLLQLVLFGLAAGGLAQAGEALLGVLFFVAAVADLAALIVLGGTGLSGTGAP